MAGAPQEEKPSAQGRRSRPREVRKSAVLHAAPRRHDGLQEYPLPKTFRDHRSAERGVSGLGPFRPAPQSFLTFAFFFIVSSNFIARSVVFEFLDPGSSLSDLPYG